MEILDPELDGALRRAVDAAVAANAALEQGRQAVYRALDLLAALARDAPRALGDDHEAAERVRLLLSLAAELAAPFHEGEELVGDTKLELEAIDERVLIRHGGVVLLALCAARVGADLALSTAFVDVVFGLALAASSAERLAKAVAAGLDAGQLAAALAALTSRDAAKSQLAAFLTSLPERRRWLCLVGLRRQLLADLDQAAWDATARHGILAVEPRAACPRQPVVIQVRAAAPAAELAASQPLSDERSAAWYLPRLVGPAASARLVFAASGRSPLAVPAGLVDAERGLVRAQVPDGAVTGWVGFFDEVLRSRSNEFRLRLRQLWGRRNQSEVCLQGAPVPVDEIALLGDPPLPPPLGGARLRAGAPRIRHYSAGPPRLEPGQAARVAWSIDGADVVVFDPPIDAARAQGDVELPLPEGTWRLPIEVSAENTCGVSKRRALLTRRVLLGPISFGTEQSGPPLMAGEPTTLRSSYAPADAQVAATLELDGRQTLAKCGQGNISVELSAEQLRAGTLQGTLRLFSEPPEPESEDDLQPLLTSSLSTRVAVEGALFEDEKTFTEVVVSARARRVVLVRPALLGPALRRVPAEVARAALERAARRRAEALEILQPAWIDDAELALDGNVDSGAGPNADELLERLEGLAARHAGLERALWLAIVPAPGGEPETPPGGVAVLRSHPPANAEIISRSESGEGAAALAIASPDGIESALEATAAMLTEPSTERLRFTGVLHAGGRITSGARARLERREAGPGARFSTGLVLVGFDARARERVRRPLTVLRRGLPARFSVLLPLPPEVVAVEVRELADQRADVLLPGPPLLRLYRPEGQLELAPLRLEGNRLHVGHQHSAGARPEIVVEVGSRRVWSPIALVPPCAEFVDLPLDRLAPGASLDAVRLVGTDGWNTDTEELPLDHATPAERALIRRAGERRLWADVEPALAPLQWQLDGSTLTTPLIELPPNFAGTVVLKARADAGNLEDRLEIGGR